MQTHADHGTLPHGPVITVDPVHSQALMGAPQDHLHPTFEKLLPRSEKERLLGQRSVCIWMTGLSGSGKTTIAAALESLLLEHGAHTMVLDGDNVRSGINSDLGFGPADRVENIRRIAEVARLFVHNGIITICCFVSPTTDLRQQARSIIGDADFLEVFVDTPLEECERRDVKGLYAKARIGEVKEFTGISAPFEPPEHADITLLTVGNTALDSARELMDRILPRISRK
jgi:adenylylsulfate kinase